MSSNPMTGLGGTARTSWNPGHATSLSRASAVDTGNEPRTSVLTQADWDVVFAATGQRIEPGAGRETPVPVMAIQIAMDRRSGRLSAGQDVTAHYLLARSAEIDRAKGAVNPFSGEHLDAALKYLASRPARVDVNL